MTREALIRLSDHEILQVYLPKGENSGHWVNVPYTVSGLQIIAQLLRVRKQAGSAPSIGQPGAPTQGQLNEMIRKYKANGGTVKTAPDTAAAAPLKSVTATEKAVANLTDAQKAELRALLGV